MKEKDMLEPLLAMGDNLKTRIVQLDEGPGEVLDSVLGTQGSPIDVVLLDVQGRRGGEKDAWDWVACWEKAIDRGGPFCRARAPRLAVVGNGFDADFIGSLEKRGIFVVDRLQAGFSEDAETGVRQRLHQILSGGAQSHLLLLLLMLNSFGPAGGPSESEADPAYEMMPVPEVAAYDQFIDWLRRGRRIDSD